MDQCWLSVDLRRKGYNMDHTAVCRPPQSSHLHVRVIGSRKAAAVRAFATRAPAKRPYLSSMVRMYEGSVKFERGRSQIHDSSTHSKPTPY